MFIRLAASLLQELRNREGSLLSYSAPCPSYPIRSRHSYKKRRGSISKWAYARKILFASCTDDLWSRGLQKWCHIRDCSGMDTICLLWMLCLVVAAVCASKGGILSRSFHFVEDTASTKTVHHWFWGPLLKKCMRFSRTFDTYKGSWH